MAWTRYGFGDIFPPSRLWWEDRYDLFHYVVPENCPPYQGNSWQTSFIFSSVNTVMHSFVRSFAPSAPNWARALFNRELRGSLRIPVSSPISASALLYAPVQTSDGVEISFHTPDDLLHARGGLGEPHRRLLSSRREPTHWPRIVFLSYDKAEDDQPDLFRLAACACSLRCQLGLHSISLASLTWEIGFFTPEPSDT